MELADEGLSQGVDVRSTRLIADGHADAAGEGVLRLNIVRGEEKIVPAIEVYGCGCPDCVGSPSDVADVELTIIIDAAGKHSYVFKYDLP